MEEKNDNLNSPASPSDLPDLAPPALPQNSKPSVAASNFNASLPTQNVAASTETTAAPSSTPPPPPPSVTAARDVNSKESIPTINNPLGTATPSINDTIGYADQPSSGSGFKLPSISLSK